MNETLMTQEQTARPAHRDPWIIALPRQVKRVMRALFKPFEVRCVRCDTAMTVLSETPTTMTATVVCWRREAECGRCGERVSRQVVQHLPDGL